MSCNRLEDDDLLSELGGELNAHVEQCEDCSARVRGYRQIAGMIAEGATVHRLPADWEHRTLARVDAARLAQRVRPTRRRRVITFSALAAVAAVITLFLITRRNPPVEPSGTPSLEMQIVEEGGWRGEAHPGNEVRARALAAGERYFEIRVYHGARDLLVRCPGERPPVCREPDRSLLVWRLPSVGTYQILLLVSSQPIAEPHGSLDHDVEKATAAGARVIDVQALHVR